VAYTCPIEIKLPYLLSARSHIGIVRGEHELLLPAPEIEGYRPGVVPALPPSVVLVLRKVVRIR
jgi:hypothetical protein